MAIRSIAAGVGDPATASGVTMLMQSHRTLPTSVAQQQRPLRDPEALGDADAQQVAVELDAVVVRLDELGAWVVHS